MKHITRWILILLFFNACKTPDIIEDTRVDYNLTTKKLSRQKDASKELQEPIRYQSGRILKIEIRHYNPLREEVSTDDSTSISFLADTASFSRFILLPNVSDFAVPAAAAAPAAVIPAAPPHPGHAAAAPAPETDCNKLTTIMGQFSTQKNKLVEVMTVYKAYLSQIENINDCYTSLQKLDDLQTADVDRVLTNDFIARLNIFLAANGIAAVSAAPATVNTRDLEEIGSTLYNEIKVERKTMAAIIDLATPLKGSNCSEFISLYKTFSSKVTDLQTQLTQFDSDYSEKAYPGFEKTLGIYAGMKKYLTNIPFVVAKTPIISNDEHFLRIYKKTADQPQKLHVDDITIEPVRGWKVDIAAGLFFSGLTDKTYSMKSKDSIFTKQFVNAGVVSDSTIQGRATAIYQQGQSAVSIGGMIFLHAHTQNSGFFNYGISLGFGSLFNDQTRWAASIGPTILIGKNQRFNINPSIMISKVTRLAPPYKTDTWYTETIDNIPTYSAMKVSWGIGLSWNFHP